MIIESPRVLFNGRLGYIVPPPLVPPAIAYIHDANTWVWNFTANLTTDETGTPSVAECGEMVRGAAGKFEQPIKASQPLLNANGIEFDGSNFSIGTATGFTPTLNGVTGLYVAMLVKWDVAVLQNKNLMKIYSGVNTAQNGRFRVATANNAVKDYTAYADERDGNHNIARLSNTTDPTTGWELLEWKLDVANDTGTSWLDGEVEDSTLDNPFTNASYPATNSLGILWMPNFDGILKGFAVYEGVIPDENRTSIHDYLASLAP